jgi:hypothetical protein
MGGTVAPGLHEAFVVWALAPTGFRVPRCPLSKATVLKFDRMDPVMFLGQVFWSKTKHT